MAGARARSRPKGGSPRRGWRGRLPEHMAAVAGPHRTNWATPEGMRARLAATRTTLSGRSRRVARGYIRTRSRNKKATFAGYRRSRLCIARARADPNLAWIPRGGHVDQ